MTTVEDVLAICAIARDRGPWKVTRDGSIRNPLGECPICAVANCVMPDSGICYTLDALTASIDVLGADFGPDLLSLLYVMDAADNPNEPGRRALMAALRMEDA